MNFKESDKVVRSPKKGVGKAAFLASGVTLIGELPQRGRVYVVSKVYSHSKPEGLILVGSSTIHNATGIEVGWNSTFFRKLEEVQAENEMIRANQEALEEARKLINLY